MPKLVTLKKSAYEWFLRHRFAAEDVIVGAVQYLPSSLRKYSDPTHFTLTLNRRKNHEFVLITIWVEETRETFIVYKLHSTRA